MNSKQVHVIYLVGTEGRAYTITNAEASDYFGVPCLKGRAVSAKQLNWTEGSTAYIPLARIEVVVVFENEKEWKAGLKNFRRRTPR